MKNLHSSKLTSTTPNGADGYIQIFEQALQDLEETKHYYDPTMKKIMFLDNIQGESYKIVVEMLKLDDVKTYDDCIIKIRRRSVDVEKERKIPGKRFFCRANKTGAQARPAGRAMLGTTLHQTLPGATILYMRMFGTTCQGNSSRL
jgi:hypothetical protein